MSSLKYNWRAIAVNRNFYCVWENWKTAENVGRYFIPHENETVKIAIKTNIGISRWGKYTYTCKAKNLQKKGI